MSDIRERDGGAPMDLDALYVKFGSALRRHLFFLCRNREIAEDLLQETFLRIQKSWDTFDPARGGFLAWARTIARNIHLRNLGKSSQTGSLDSNLLELEADPRADVQEDIEKKTVSEMVNVAIGCLPEPERSIIECKYRDNLTLDQMAERLNISRRTVSRRYLKALEILRRKLEEVGLTELP